MYMWPFIGFALLVKWIHQYYNPWSDIQAMKIRYFPILYSEQTSDCDFHYLYIWSTDDWELIGFIGYFGIHQWIIHDYINRLYIKIHRTHDRTWPHQDDPWGLSIGTYLKMTQLFNYEFKSLMNFNTPAITQKGLVCKQ